MKNYKQFKIYIYTHVHSVKKKKLIEFQHTESAVQVQSEVWYKKQLFFKICLYEHIQFINIFFLT